MSENTDTTTEKTVAPEHLFSLIREADEKKKRAQSISGDVGERVKAAVENGHLDRGAFGLVLKLHRQDELKRNSSIRSIRLYLDLCEEKLWAGQGHTGDLAEEAEIAAAEDAERQASANADALSCGIKPLRTEKEVDAERAEIAAQLERDTRHVDEPYNEGLVRARGKAAFTAGHPGMVPDDLLAAPKPITDAFLEAWSEASKASAGAKDDAAGTSRNRRRNNPLPGAEGVGTYATH